MSDMLIWVDMKKRHDIDEAVGYFPMHLFVVLDANSEIFSIFIEGGKEKVKGVG